MFSRSAVTAACFLLAATAAAPLLQGCVVAAVGGVGAGAVDEFSQQRSVSQQLRDTATAAAINQQWRQYDPRAAEDLDVRVYDGRVLLVGRVPNEGVRQAMSRIAYQQQDVRQVYNDILVGPGSDFSQRTESGLITTKLKAALIGDAAVREPNYDIETVQGIVYILGSARSPVERDDVLNHARNIDGVRRVVTYVRVEAGAPPPAPPPPMPPAGGMEAPPPRYETPAPRSYAPPSYQSAPNYPSSPNYPPPPPPLPAPLNQSYPPPSPYAPSYAPPSSSGGSSIDVTPLK